MSSSRKLCPCCLSGLSQETYSGVEPLGLLTSGCKNKIKKGKPHLEISVLPTACMYPYMLVYYYLSFYIVPWVHPAFRSGAYLHGWPGGKGTGSPAKEGWGCSSPLARGRSHACTWGAVPGTTLDRGEMPTVKKIAG